MRGKRVKFLNAVKLAPHTISEMMRIYGDRYVQIPRPASNPFMLINQPNARFRMLKKAWTNQEMRRVA